jgi:hypothetical protein
MGIQNMGFTFHQPYCLMPRSVRPATGSWQATMPGRSVFCQMELACGNDSFSQAMRLIEKTFIRVRKINAVRSGFRQKAGLFFQTTNAAVCRHAATIQRK